MKKNESITIKKITRTDLDEIIQLGLSTKELWADKTPEYYSKEQLVSFIKSPYDIYYAAKIDNELAGYFIATFNPYLKEAYLIDLVVKRKFRRRGVGKLLFEKVMSTLKRKGCPWVWTLIHENNQIMMNLMGKMGFTKGRKFYFYYRNKTFS